MMQAPPEQLGSFYLGAIYDLENGQRTETPLHYDARDLVTHAVCVGMTGSGKTGLCLGLLEEAALDKVPALLIDPKGDITNLLLQFPKMQPADFQPWVNVDDARRKDKSVEEFAASTAESWRSGLADWGITGERMRLLAAHTDYTIFTPGSEMGTPINIMGSLAAPQLDWATQIEAIREQIGGTVAALLSLAGVTADPVRSREGILLATLFEQFWQQGKDLDLTQLINGVTNPPFKQLGAFEVDTFYPAKESTGCSLQPTANRATASSISPISATANACSSSRCCWKAWSPGCASKAGPPACVRCSILTRSSATSPLPPSPPLNARC